jgi:hypothetical protein
MIWIPFAVAGALLVPLLVGLVVAAMLGEIAARLSELDYEAWTSMPLVAHRSTSDR